MKCSANGTSDKNKNIMKTPEGGFGVAKVFLCPAGTLLDLYTIISIKLIRYFNDCRVNNTLPTIKENCFYDLLLLRDLFQNTNREHGSDGTQDIQVKLSIRVTFLISCAFITFLALIGLGGVDILFRMNIKKS